MSADDLWLVRRRYERFYPIHTFASPIVEGNMPDEPHPSDTSFATLAETIAYCEDTEDTEYGVIVENPAWLKMLRDVKARDAQAVRDAIDEVLGGER